MIMPMEVKWMMRLVKVAVNGVKLMVVNMVLVGVGG